MTTDRVWLFGDVGSKTILRHSGDQVEQLSLAEPLTFQIESKGFASEQIFLHGTDGQGEPQTLIIDTSAPGSIESGRGFLNFLFLTVLQRHHGRDDLDGRVATHQRPSLLKKASHRVDLCSSSIDSLENLHLLSATTEKSSGRKEVNRRVKTRDDGPIPWTSRLNIQIRF